EPRLRHRASLVRDELVVREPDDRADRALDRDAEEPEQVSDRGVRAAQASRREGGAAAAQEIGRESDRPDRRAGALYRRRQAGPVQSGSLPLLSGAAYSSYASALPASAVSTSLRPSRGENSSMKVKA